MGERKAQNKYYPSDFDPEAHVNINRYRRIQKNEQRDLERDLLGIEQEERQKKIGKTVRFEMPFNSWCLKCEHHIGMGVRFNASKIKTGDYFSTPIFQFHFKCPNCKEKMIMEIDPKNTEYLCIEGLKRKTEVYDEIEINQERDAFEELEHKKRDHEKLLQDSELIEQLQEKNDQQWKDVFSVSKRLRQNLRQEKIQKQSVMEKFQKKYQLNVPLQKAIQPSEDLKLPAFKTQNDLEKKMKILKKGSIFEQKESMTKQEWVDRELKKKQILSEQRKQVPALVKRKVESQASAGLVQYSSDEDSS